MRFIVYWGLRRDQLCDKDICPHEDKDEICPLDSLDAAKSSEEGSLLQRGLELRAALNLGIQLSLEDIMADELLAMLIVEEEQNRLEDEKSRKE